MSGTWIGYENILASATVAFSIPDGSVTNGENCYDFNGYDFATIPNTNDLTIDIDYGSNATCRYVAVGSKNTMLNTGVDVYTSADSGYTSPVSVETDTAAEDQYYMRVFDQDYTSRYWRIFIQQGVLLKPYHIALGGAIMLPHGFTPQGFVRPTMAHNDRIINNVSQGGSFLGRVTQRRGKSFSVTIQNLDNTWLDANWFSFIDHARTKPFSFSWSSTNSFEDEAVFAWIKDAEQLPRPTFKTPRLTNIVLNLEAQ